MANVTSSTSKLLHQWPLFGLRINTDRFELRVPTDNDLGELIDVAKHGVHDPDTQPFAVPWTDLPSPQFERKALQFHWSCRAEFSPTKWNLGLVVVRNDRVIGMQGLGAQNFPVLRTAETGSWLGKAWQGQGIGKEMRAAIIRFAFDYLRADEITSGAMSDNVSSQRVSMANGYEENGRSLTERRGGPFTHLRFRLTRQRWETTQHNGSAVNVPISVSGFDESASMFGVDTK
jgi:RimJ/RimL family protein N-acetyltransferase